MKWTKKLPTKINKLYWWKPLKQSSRVSWKIIIYNGSMEKTLKRGYWSDRPIKV